MRRLPTAVIALTLTAAAGLVPAAQATFPGRNGGIAFEQRSSSGDSGPNVEHSRLATRPPGSAGFRTLLDCERPTECRVAASERARKRGYRRRIRPTAARSCSTPGTQIGIIDADGGGGVGLFVPANVDDGHPAFSPDANRIVFTGANDHGTSDLYVRRATGGPARRMIRDAGEPAWSSRNTLAYVRSGNV